MKAKTGTGLPRLLIEEWLPAAAIGVECIRERSTGQQPPDKRLHVWWARRPLAASRAAVLGSLLPADFPREVFERLLGFGRPGADLVRIRKLMDTGKRIEGGFGCERAFKRPLRDDDLEKAHDAGARLWGSAPMLVLDPMAGGGSIPLEAATLGVNAIANEYNPVACSVLEATVDYPFRYGLELAAKTRKWGNTWVDRVAKRLSKFYPAPAAGLVHAYIYARTVPCPDTQHPTPLVPDWHLVRTKGQHGNIVANPIVDEKRGTWHVEIKELGKSRDQLREAPRPTYSDGKGVSIFTGRLIPAEYIKAKAQAGEMKSALYAVAVKTRNEGLRFRTPDPEDLEAIARAEREWKRASSEFVDRGFVPTELIPQGVQPGSRLEVGGIRTWADLFAPRQLLAFCTLAAEIQELRPEIESKEGVETATAIGLLLAVVLDKFANHNCILARFENTRQAIKGIFGRHGYEFHVTHAEMAPCNAGVGLDWAIDNVLEAYEAICKLPRHPKARPVEISMGTATSLPQIEDRSVTAVVVDPPYSDNVQYAELANFFYVWLKRTQGHRRPEWFSTYLCDHSQEAVVNVARHADGVGGKQPDGKRKKGVGQAKAKANEFYQGLMTEVFKECHRVLRDDGALTVMFTHKRQDAWEALFSSLIRAGFMMTATWPVKTESEHSLHQAKKNAAQSTVILVARKRARGAGVGFFDASMREEIREKARSTAKRLQAEGLNPVDQLVGSFGPAMEVYSRFDEVRTDTGQDVGVEHAIDEAADAVSTWRVEQVAARGLDSIEPEGRFTLLCWDVLGAAEFRFNEAKLLGHAVGMDVDAMVRAGLVARSSEKMQMLSVKDRRRERALEPDEVTQTIFGPEVTPRKRKKADGLKVHPNDPFFRTALDACHALALRYLEAGSPAGGIGSAKALVRQHRWTKDSPVARLMEALVCAAPVALRHDSGKASAAAKFPEFRAWHALLEPLFGIHAPDWTPERQTTQGELSFQTESTEADEREESDEDVDGEGGGGGDEEE